MKLTKFHKVITTFFVFTAIIFASCQSKRTVFPLQRLTGYTDSMLIEKYKNVDIADFQRLENTEFIRHMFHWAGEKELERRNSTIQRQRMRYPKRQISSIEEVNQWLREVYRSHLPCSHSCEIYHLSHYTQVDDGFLIKGRPRTHSDMVFPRCAICIRWQVFLVGYDHNILFIKGWSEDPCPDEFHRDRHIPNITFRIHFPDFEDAEKNTVTFPKLPRGTIDRFLLDNVRYPLSALENLIKGKVLVSFIVETDGSVSNLMILRSVYPSLDREAVRSIKATDGKWISGMKNGEKTPFEIVVEFNFGWIINQRCR